jgi:hypothetical protein
VIERLPTRSDEVVKVALPLASSFLVPRMVDAYLKVTVPVGVPAPGLTAATVAVKVTAWR